MKTKSLIQECLLQLNNSKALETAQVPINGRIDKLVYLYNGMLFINMKEWITHTRKANMKLKNIMLSKEALYKKCT